MIIVTSKTAYNNYSKDTCDHGIFLDWCFDETNTDRKGFPAFRAERLFLHPWHDRSLYEKDYYALSYCYEELLAFFSKRFCEINGRSASLTSVRILAGPWLAYTLQVLFDRYRVVKYLREVADNATLLLAPTVQVLRPVLTMADYLRNVQEDEFNALVLREIATELKVPTLVSEGCDLEVRQKKGDGGRVTSTYGTIRRGVRKVISRCLYKSNPSGKIIQATYQSTLEEFWLALSLGTLPSQIVDLETDFFTTFTPNKLVRDKLFEDYPKLIIDETFNRIFRSLAGVLCPYYLLEAYTESRQFALGRPIDRIGKRFIFTSNDMWHHTRFLFLMSDAVDRGGKIIIGQHGAGYGVDKFNFAEQHEVAIANKFLSWGRWGDTCSVDEHGITVGVGLIKPILKPARKRKPTENIQLLVLPHCMGSYNYRLASSVSVSRANEYKALIDLIERLINNPNLVLSVRLIGRVGECMSTSLENRFPAISLDFGKSSAIRQFTRSDIVFHMYNSTGFLESLACNVPTLLYWTEEETPVRTSARPFYQSLEEANIVHTNLEKAIKFLEKISDHRTLDGWWNSNSVQAPRRRFLAMYASDRLNIGRRIRAQIKS
jgi:putative transferase (TIGR04331 family)